MNGMRHELFGRPAGPHVLETGGNPGQYSEHEQRMLEEQNDEKIDALFSSVEALKARTLGINQEVTEQNRLLDSMQLQMESAGSMLASTVDKMKELYATSGGGNLCKLTLFFMFVLFLLYFLAFRRS